MRYAPQPPATKLYISEALFSHVTQCSLKSKMGPDLLQNGDNLKSRSADLTWYYNIARKVEHWTIVNFHTDWLAM